MLGDSSRVDAYIVYSYPQSLALQADWGLWKDEVSNFTVRSTETTIIVSINAAYINTSFLIQSIDIVNILFIRVNYIINERKTTHNLLPTSYIAQNEARGFTFP